MKHRTTPLAIWDVPTAVRVLIYRYEPGAHVRGGRRTLVHGTERTRINPARLRVRLEAGRYRLEWRSQAGRVLRVRRLVVRARPNPAAPASAGPNPWRAPVGPGPDGRRYGR